MKKVDRIGFHNDDYSLDENNEYKSDSTPLCGIVKDFDGTVLFKTKEYDLVISYNDENNQGGYTEKYNDKYEEIKLNLNKECESYLKNNYPDYDSHTAYWDDTSILIKKEV